MAKSKDLTGKMKNSEFHQFFIDEIKDIYWAENHLAKSLPKLEKAATTAELKAAIQKHTKETEGHIEKLNTVFELMDEKPEAKKCEAMAGLLKEGDSIVDDTEKSTMTRDAGIILAAQKCEHYEIATYGTLKTFAENMGHTQVAQILNEILENEKDTDVALTEIAVNSINEKAAEE